MTTEQAGRRGGKSSRRKAATAQPDPECWPQCPTCSTAWVLRRAFAFPTDGREAYTQWVWQRDCKHRNAEPVMATKATGEQT